MGTFYNLPAEGQKVTLLIHFVVREDAQILYGFGTPTERAAFRELIKISGVGPRTALSILSGMDVGDLSQAITLQDAGRLTKVPGIGKKTAGKLHSHATHSTHTAHIATTHAAHACAAFIFRGFCNHALGSQHQASH